MKVRKTIYILKEMEELLEELSRAYRKPQSEIIEELIREKARERKLKLFKELVSDIEPYRGKIGNISVQEVKVDKLSQ